MIAGAAPTAQVIGGTTSQNGLGKQGASWWLAANGTPGQPDYTVCGHHHRTHGAAVQCARRQWPHTGSGDREPGR